jgi:glucokinase
MTTAIGIDLGATHVKFVHLDDLGHTLASGSFPTDDNPTATWPQRIRDQIAHLQKQNPTDRIGLCAPGLAARDTRSIAWMQGRLNQLQGLDWTKFLNAPRTIPILNDAHAALLGEVWKGAAVGAQNAVLLTLGTGVGGAILANGKLLRGAIGRAGHLGHISLDPTGPPDIVATPGSLENAIGDCTIHQRTNDRFTSTRDLVAAHVAGDQFATKIWLRAVRHLAAGITSIINAVDPEIIIIGGGIAAAGDALFRRLHDFLNTMEWRPLGEPVKILPAKLGDLAGAIGSAYNAMQAE